jgi:hypothetical protein
MKNRMTKNHDEIINLNSWRIALKDKFEEALLPDVRYGRMCATVFFAPIVFQTWACEIMSENLRLTRAILAAMYAVKKTWTERK